MHPPLLFERNIPRDMQQRSEGDVDEVRFESEFIRNIISKLLARLLWKKLDCSAEIRLHEAEIKICEGRTSIHLNIDAEMENSELMQLLRKNGIEGLE